MSLVLALAAGVLAVALVRSATTAQKPSGVVPERPVSGANPGDGEVAKPAQLSLARRAFPVH